MFKHLVVISLVGVLAQSVIAYKTKSAPLLVGKLGGSLGGGLLVAGGGAGRPAVLSAAIQTRHSVHEYPVPSGGVIQPATVEVGANAIPITILFRSASSLLNLKHLHEGAPGTQQETSSEDEPHRLIHSVVKPVVQEVREVIVPFRRITQEIQPVQEEVQTIVARGQPGLAAGPGAGGAGAGGLSGGAGGSGGLGGSTLTLVGPGSGLGGGLGGGLGSGSALLSKPLGSKKY